MSWQNRATLRLPRLLILAVLCVTAWPLTSHAKTVNIEMTAVETDVVIDGEGTTYKAWTFNGQFPGPVLRVTEGDRVRFRFTNPATNSRSHSMDFHAAETNFMNNYHEISPGETMEYEWKAKRPGVFVYHCGATPMIQHVARGMVGTIIVDPKNPKAMPKADREYVLVQTELYKKDPDDLQAMFDRQYDFVMFNGGVFRYDPIHAAKGGHFLEAKPGERVRFYFVNGGPNNFSALHPIAEIWDDVWESGNPANHLQGVQTYVVGPAGAAILDMVVDQEGFYPIVTHSLTDALRGAIAILEVKKDAQKLPLLPYVQPVEQTPARATN
jgi:nitrite reductase (NO-forming)